MSLRDVTSLLDPCDFFSVSKCSRCRPPSPTRL
jgi:hypothetical protein